MKNITMNETLWYVNDSIHDRHVRQIVLNMLAKQWLRVFFFRRLAVFISKLKYSFKWIVHFEEGGHNWWCLGCSFYINDLNDGDSCTKVASTYMVERFGLRTTKHLKLFLHVCILYACTLFVLSNLRIRVYLVSTKPMS